MEPLLVNTACLQTITFCLSLRLAHRPKFFSLLLRFDVLESVSVKPELDQCAVTISDIVWITCLDSFLSKRKHAHVLGPCFGMRGVWSRRKGEA